MNDLICNCIYCSGGYEPPRTIDYDEDEYFDEYCKEIDDEYLDEMDRRLYDEYNDYDEEE